MKKYFIAYIGNGTYENVKENKYYASKKSAEKQKQAKIKKLEDELAKLKRTVICEADVEVEVKDIFVGDIYCDCNRNYIVKNIKFAK